MLCTCNDGSTSSVKTCDQCTNNCKGGYSSCIDNKTLGMVTEVFITLLVLSYVFFSHITLFCNENSRTL